MIAEMDRMSRRAESNLLWQTQPDGNDRPIQHSLGSTLRATWPLSNVTSRVCATLNRMLRVAKPLSVASRNALHCPLNRRR